VNANPAVTRWGGRIAGMGGWNERNTQLVELTPRNAGRPLKDIIRGINDYMVGWMGFFGICEHWTRHILRDADSHLRRRLRAIQLRLWKRRRTVVRKLMRLGARQFPSHQVMAKRRKWWAMSKLPVVSQTLGVKFFQALGLKSLLALWKESKHRQLTLGGDMMTSR